MVEGLLEAVILLLAIVDRYLVTVFRYGEYIAEIEALRLPVVDRLADVEAIGMANHFAIAAVAEFGHPFAHLFGNEHEEIDQVFRFRGEALAQFRILRGDADRAGVEVTFAHHDAAFGD